MAPPRRDVHAFLGLSLTRNSPRGHPASTTHQQAFDFDKIQDRDGEYIFSMSDDGWLAGGGEPPKSNKLPGIDSAHVEIMRVADLESVVEILKSGKILIPEITVVPMGVVCAGGGRLPDLEVRFDTVPSKPNFSDPMAALPLNWQLRFIQNQLIKILGTSSRFEFGRFHATILRQVEFRTDRAKTAYLANCRRLVEEWMDRGQQPLVPAKIEDSVEVIKCKRGEKQGDQYLADHYRSGLWLFMDGATIQGDTIHRKKITHHFLPNFPPPYDAPATRRIIYEILKDDWDEKSLCWKPSVL